MSPGPTSRRGRPPCAAESAYRRIAAHDARGDSSTPLWHLTFSAEPGAAVDSAHGSFPATLERWSPPPRREAFRARFGVDEARGLQPGPSSASLQAGCGAEVLSPSPGANRALCAVPLARASVLSVRWEE